MPAIINGKAILVYFEGEPIAYLTSDKESVKNNLRETTHKRSGGGAGGVAEYAGGKVQFEGSAEGFMVSKSKNLLQRSEDFANAIWVKNNCPVTSNNAVGNDGRSTADTLTFGSGGNIIQQIADGSTQPADVAVFSVWLKGSGTVEIAVGDDDDEITQPIILDSTLTRYTVYHALVTGTGVFVRIEKDSATSCVAWGAQLEKNVGAIATGYDPSGYTYASLFAAMKAGTELACVVSDYQSTHEKYTSIILLNSLERTSNDNDNVTFSCSYNVSGNNAEGTI